MLDHLHTLGKRPGGKMEQNNFHIGQCKSVTCITDIPILGTFGHVQLLVSQSNVSMGEHQRVSTPLFVWYPT